MGTRGPKPLTMDEFAERFWQRVDRSAGATGCWPWLRGHLASGYGVVNARAILAHPTTTHRVAYWLTHGRWPSQDTRHGCDNYGCCNPAHLLDGSHRQNMQDAMERGRFKIGGRTTGTWSKGDTLQDRRRKRAEDRVRQQEVRGAHAEHHRAG